MKTSKAGRAGYLFTLTAVSMAVMIGAAQADTIRLWTIEEQPDRLAKQQSMADQFKEL